MNDTPYGYGIVSKILHWLIAAVVIGNLIAGLLLDDMAMPGKMTVILWHKSVGVLVLALMLVRLGWRSNQGFPKFPDALPRWQQQLARFVHLAFYPVLILMPVVDWLLSSAAGYPVMFFGLFSLPAIWEKDKAWAEIFSGTHSALGYVIIAMLVAHIGAALYHHFIEKQKIIKRML